MPKICSILAAGLLAMLLSACGNPSPTPPLTIPPKVEAPPIANGGAARSGPLPAAKPIPEAAKHR